MTTGPTDVPVPSGTSRDLYTLGRKLDDHKRRLDFVETQRGIVCATAQDSIQGSNGFSVGVFGEALFQMVDVPRGYSQCQVALFCATTQQLIGTSSSGLVGVQPVVDNDFYGLALSNGVTGQLPVSVSSFYAVHRTGLAPRSQIRLAAWVTNVGPLAPGLASVSLSASLTFMK